MNSKSDSSSLALRTLLFVGTERFNKKLLPIAEIGFCLGLCCTKSINQFVAIKSEMRKLSLTRGVLQLFDSQVRSSGVIHRVKYRTGCFCKYSRRGLNE